MIMFSRRFVFFSIAIFAITVVVAEELDSKVLFFIAALEAVLAFVLFLLMLFSLEDCESMRESFNKETKKAKEDYYLLNQQFDKVKEEYKNNQKNFQTLLNILHEKEYEEIMDLVKRFKEKEGATEDEKR